MGHAIQPIIGGIASPASQDAIVVLARFENGARVSLCTATLVAANLALTARHCVTDTDASAGCGSDGLPVVGAMLHADYDPTTLAIFTTSGGTAPSTLTDFGASAHGKSLTVDGATSLCNHDLAFIVLDLSINAPIAQLRLAPANAGDTLTAVGFGITEAGLLPVMRMQRTNIPLVGLGPMAYPDDARYGVGSSELLVGESACSGDSGSPALAKSGAIVGVASRAGNGAAHDPNNAAATCLGAHAHAVYTQLSTNATLLQRAFADAGATPWLEGQPDPRTAQTSVPPPAKAGPGAGQNVPGGPTAMSTVGGPAVLPPSIADLAPVEASASGSGCSASGAPVRGAVEEALGILAVVLLAARIRSKARRRPRINADDP